MPSGNYYPEYCEDFDTEQPTTKGIGFIFLYATTAFVFLNVLFDGKLCMRLSAYTNLSDGSNLNIFFRYRSFTSLIK